MIHADLQGKTHIGEDVLTSNCLGLLRLLPDSNLVSFLGAAVGLNGETIDLSSYEAVTRIQFWPWLPNGGEPDVIVELQNRSDRTSMAVVIEAKHGAGKSGSSPSLQTVTDPLDDGDQLARYWRAAKQCLRYCSEITLIYLTHHRSLPKEDIQTSLRAAGEDAKIYWLSWFHLYRLIAYWNLESNRPTTERRVLETLHNYLDAKGYVCFLGWSALQYTRNHLPGYLRTYPFNANHPVPIPYARTYSLSLVTKPVKQNCQLDYNRVYSFDVAEHCQLPYKRFFESDLIKAPMGSLCFYRIF